MQIAYFDCFSGISGDMTLGALIDAGAELSLVQSAIASMDLGDVRITVANTERRGFRGKLLTIDYPPEHAHRYLRDILSLLRRARISSGAKDLAMRLFEKIARAEAKVHGTTIDRVQFHEVGAIDSIVDIVGVSVAWDSLQIERAYASSVPTGAGQVRIAHGLVSVPAPATAELLLGVPIAPTQIPLEMTTPTGAAIVTELASEFGPMPPMQVGRIGYGAGSKDMPDRPNLLRILIGNALKLKPRRNDSILVMESNLDDVTGEQIGFAIERLWKAGALDVFTVPIQMKKNRPGTLITVIANPHDRQAMESILFQQTGTLGIRYRTQARTVLPRAAVDVRTPWGIVAGKVSKLPSGDIDFSPEYDDCSKIAASFGLRLTEVVGKVIECYRENSNNIAQVGMVDATDAPCLNGASDLRNGILELDSVNAVFRQAAVEDELDSVACSSIELETNQNLERASNPTKPSLDDTSQFVDPTVVSSDNSQESEREEYYRWDSSPWTAAPSSPLPRENTPREFPIQGEWDS